MSLSRQARVAPPISERPSVLETLLEAHFADDHLAEVLGLDSPEAVELARRALIFSRAPANKSARGWSIMGFPSRTMCCRARPRSRSVRSASWSRCCTRVR
jgi:hypothetical protein